jgi:TPP-dependent trihydroxycyclohexane-1,2-dione (THcHDO) dehydratase
MELVAKNHDFDLLGILRAQGKDHEFKKATQDPVAQRQDDEVARSRLHGRRRLRHAPSSVTVAAQEIPDHEARTEFSAPTRLGAEKTTVIHIETDPSIRVPNFESWWDFPVAEVPNDNR